MGTDARRPGNTEEPPGLSCQCAELNSMSPGHDYGPISLEGEILCVRVCGLIWLGLDTALRGWRGEGQSTSVAAVSWPHHFARQHLSPGRPQVPIFFRPPLQTTAHTPLLLKQLTGLLMPLGKTARKQKAKECQHPVEGPEATPFSGVSPCRSPSKAWLFLRATPLGCRLLESPPRLSCCFCPSS